MFASHSRDSATEHVWGAWFFFIGLALIIAFGTWALSVCLGTN